MKYNKPIFTLILLMFSSAAFAITHYCANTQKYINIGDTVAQVKLACGEPESTSAGPQVGTQKVEQWFYHHNHRGLRKIGDHPEVTVLFVNDKVAVVQSGNLQLSSIDFCGGASVSVGDSPASVRAKCGPPAFINKGTQEIRLPPNSIQILTYNNGPFQPKTVLTFSQGKLTSIKNQP